MKKTSVWFWSGAVLCFGLSVAVYFFGQTLSHVPHLADKGASWYYWKLATPTFMGRLSAWGFFALHLGSVYFIIWKMHKNPAANKGNVGKYQFWLLGVNALFIGLHFLQTHFWYDGLAQDVSIWSSQFSVIGMLVLLLILQNGRRGLFFGKKIAFVQKSVPTLTKFHGIYIAWAAIYTFWYHPMEGTVGHVIGFFYMFLLLLQVSFTGTRIHTNKYWLTSLELTVLAHGTVVAILQNAGIWPMFFFGFGMIFIMTQLYGLGLSRRVICLVTGVFILLVIAVYSGWLFGIRTFGKIDEIFRIPVIEYILVFVLSAVFGGFSKKRLPNPSLEQK